MRGVPIEWERLPAFLLTIRDITGRKRTEEALRRSNRALRVISQCNQFLIRSQDIQGLIDGICNIIVTSGGYRSAWVGYSRNDKDRTVEPVAWSGLEEKYFKGLRISWKKGRYGNGPTGTAIRSGNPTVIHDIPHNPKCGSEVPEAIRLDYITVAALPLKIKEKVIGALTIFSGDADAFDSDEMQVLSEMADDLSFGIETLRVRSAHEKAEQDLKASEIRYRRLFEAAKDGIIIMNEASERIIDANPFILDLLGYSHDSLLGKYLWEIGLLKDKSQAEQAFADLKRDGYVRYEDLPLVTKDGQKRDVEFVSNIYEVGPDTVIQCNIRDITERKQAEVALKKEKDFAETIIRDGANYCDGIGLSGTYRQLQSVYGKNFRICAGRSARQGLGHHLFTGT